MSGPVIIAAGGTGGHLFPARALAEELLGRGRAVVAVTDRRGGDIADGLSGMPVHRLRASALSGRSLAGKVSGAVDLLIGTLEARSLLRRLRPCAVVGFGGYPTVPPLYAARRLGIRTVIHEQNAVLGRANRLLAGRVDLIATSFEATAGLDAAQAARTMLTGNPVRSDIAALHRGTYRAPNGDGRLRVLVFGGSQGARILSQVVPAALESLPAGARQRFVLVQQCRPEDVAAVSQTYERLGVAAEIAPFFGDMAQRLDAAQLVICRSGASTVAELGAAGRPALLVPYRFATDDHQSANARAAEADGAAWLMPEQAFTAEALAARLEALVACPRQLVEVAAAAHRRGRPAAASALADAVERLIPANGNHGPAITEAAA